MKKITELEYNPNDAWAEVELWRWQYGELPKPDDMRPLVLRDGLLAMAEAIEKGCKEQNSKIMPSPFNICSVLRYLAAKEK